MSESTFEKVREALPDEPQYDEILEQLSSRKLNILFVGPTGVGKSSTINAMFDTTVAREGYSPDPETDTIASYALGQRLTLWDSPGFGDAPQKDQHYAEQITNLLRKKDEQGNLLIDAAVVVMDAASRDLGTTYQVLENVLCPMLGAERIVLALNRCDLSLGGRGWDETNNRPGATLQARLTEQQQSLQARIRQSLGVDITPIVYSALYRYNMMALLNALLSGIPEDKRYLLADNLRRNPEMWKSNDGLQNYGQQIPEKMKVSVNKALEGAVLGVQAGAVVGSFIPVIGPVIGAAVGAAIGFFGNLGS